MEENNKKKIVPTIIAVVTLIILVASATYAYFSVGATNNFGTKVITASTDEIGAVTLNGSEATLSMDLTAVDMMKGEGNITYYASSDGKTTTRTEEVLGVASVNPTTDTNYYHCEYTLNITQTNTGTKNMYNIFKGTQAVNSNTYTSSANEFILTVNGVDYDLHSNTLPKQIEGEFYIQGEQTQNITAGLRLVNLVDKNQNLLAGSNVQISISVVNDSFKCTAEEEPTPASETLIALTEDTNNANKIKKYNGKVTDVYTDYGTGIDATKVYVFTSNDINNVIFEDYCWKIIRTTETGGTKLLYNGLPVNGECTATGDAAMLTAAQMGTSSNKISYIQDGANDKPAYAGYMYNPNTINGTYGEQLRGDNINTTDSLFKEKIDYWFASSGIDGKKLEDAVYCNDRSLSSNSEVTEANLSTAISGDVRFKNFNQVSTLECTNEEDSFSVGNAKAQLTYKVGFLTEPERYLMTNNNSNFSTVNNDKVYWLGSPYTFSSEPYINYVDIGGGNDSYKAGHSSGVRPVVTASSSVSIQSGEGSTTNPFIFD